MPAHVACQPWSYRSDGAEGCYLVCAAHGLRQSFGFAHAVAHAACVEHNLLHHADERRKVAGVLSVMYESTATEPFQPDDLAALLSHARTRNRASGITGMLLMQDGWFVQAIEGPEPAVESLMRSIRSDPRHRRVRILSREMRQQRRFPDWAMAEGHAGDVDALPLTHYYEALLVARGQVAAA